MEPTKSPPLSGAERMQRCRARKKGKKSEAKKEDQAVNNSRMHRKVQRKETSEWSNILYLRKKQTENLRKESTKNERNPTEVIPKGCSSAQIKVKKESEWERTNRERQRTRCKNEKGAGHSQGCKSPQSLGKAMRMIEKMLPKLELHRKEVVTGMAQTWIARHWHF